MLAPSSWIGAIAHGTSKLERAYDLAQLGRELGAQRIPQAHCGHDDGYQNQATFHHISRIIGQETVEGMLKEGLDHGMVTPRE